MPPIRSESIIGLPDFKIISKQNRGEPGALGNIRLGVDLLIKGPEPAGEYLGGNQETAFNRPSPILSKKKEGITH